MAFLRSLFSRASGSKAVADRSDLVAKGPAVDYSVRIAVYDSFQTLPRIIDISSPDFESAVEQVTTKVYSLCRDKGGNMPYVVLKEAVENLIHADFCDVVISIMPDGNVVRIADHGPGISDKRRAFLPGFSTATSQMRRMIKGVGSGLPVVQESLASLGGSVILEDNLTCGSVITLTIGAPRDESPIPALGNINSPGGDRALKKDFPSDRSNRKQDEDVSPESDSVAVRTGNELSNEQLDRDLSSRQKKVFLLIAELGEIGPSTVTKELDISLSTAYRDLVTLEELSLVTSVEGGKRKVTKRGIDFLAYILK